jgi:DNA invertase Pin-like site-specific DNA recombinase
LGADDNTIFWEYESGTKANRPELNKLLTILRDGDTLVTTEVSRITRSTKQLCDIIDLCKRRKLKLVIQNSVTIDCSKGGLDPMTKAFLQMSGVFAELERDMTVSRIRSGLQNARSKGVRLGRPELTIKQIPPKVLSNYARYQNGILNKSELAKICDISRPTLNKYIAVMTDR